MKPRPPRILVAFVVPLLACGAPRPRQDLKAEQVPGIALRVRDSIDGIDFVVGSDKSIDLVWLSALRDHRNSQVTKQAWFRHRDPNGQWGRPILIAPAAWGSLRILSIGRSLHVLVGPELRHFVSLNRGQTWTELPQLHSGARTEIFDAIAFGSSIVVAYFTNLPRVQGVQKPDSTAVWTVRWSESDGASPPAIVSTFPDIASRPEPKLLSAGDEMLLFVAVNRIIRRIEPDSAREDAGIFWSRLKGDSTWSEPQRIVTLGMLHGKWREEGNGYVSRIDAAQLGDGLVLSYNAQKLYWTRFDHGKWAQVSPIALDKGWLGPAPTSSASLAVANRGGWLLWVDERFRHSDRTQTNPLGFPWFYDPDWSNNDVLALPIYALSKMGARSSEAQPLRLTRDLSYAGPIRARTAGDRAYLVWAGRERVGRELDSLGRPPTIFLMELPIDEN